MITEKERIITEVMLEEYLDHLHKEERSSATMDKYKRDLRKFMDFVGGQAVTKELTMAYKEALKADYESSSVNSMLAAVNGFLSFFGWNDCKVKRLTIQRKVFCEVERELSKEEYFRLLEASRELGQERINLIIQTICGTGIRVSELKFITVEAVKIGTVTVECKGKVRLVFIPKKLRKLLETYIRKHGLESGLVFVSRNGKPLNRSNIWRDMKALCVAAGVDAAKVFPHNLRHLFARTFYGLDNDIAKLADILGHSNIETTRIYILSSGTDHRRQVERLGLVL